MHAILITAYKDYPALRRLVRRLDPAFFRVFIHIDTRSRIGHAQIAELRGLGAEVDKTFAVRWGSYTHLRAIQHLLAIALEHYDVDYIHIVSGQDYPLWNAEQFKLRCDGRIFIDYGPLQDQPLFVRDRYELTDPFHFLLTRRFGSRALHKFLTRRTHRVRSRMFKRRTALGPYSALYKAVVWSSFPAPAARLMAQDPLAETFLKAIRKTRVAEEIYFATYFLNSEARHQVVRNGLRYIDWHERNGSNPAYLDESDAEAVLQSNALFARKVSTDRSTKLLDIIDAIRFNSASEAKS
jgi:hypothetical protein